MKRTKIVCTIGPVSNKPVILRNMIKAGMNVARFNFSHGTKEEQKHNIALLRKLSKELNEQVAILQDLQGPKIRLGDMRKEGYDIKRGGKIILTTESGIVPPKKF